MKPNPNPNLYDKLLKNNPIRELHMSRHEWRGSSPLARWHVVWSMRSMCRCHL